uniref:Uncharacterized protein n=1 Tax=Fagus sylvatica TaxID=28930 RepID=A0A2N9IRM9_FAGSY
MENKGKKITVTLLESEKRDLEKHAILGEIMMHKQDDANHHSQPRPPQTQSRKSWSQSEEGVAVAFGEVGVLVRSSRPVRLQWVSSSKSWPWPDACWPRLRRWLKLRPLSST